MRKPKQTNYFIIGFALITSGLVIYSLAGKNLNYSSDPLPEDTDLLFTFGIEPKRYDYSFWIMENEEIPNWIISDPLKYRCARVMKQKSKNYQVYCLQEAESTYQEIRHLERILMESFPEPKKVTLISSRSHLFRIENLAEKYLPQQHEYFFHSLPEAISDKPDNFYEEWYHFHNQHLEVAKILWYTFWY